MQAVFRDSGVAGTSLDRLAEATGMNRPSLYAAFRDKRAMFLMAVAAADESWADDERRHLNAPRLADGLAWLIAEATSSYLEMNAAAH